jgi:hypothetical protein
MTSGANLNEVVGENLRRLRNALEPSERGRKKLAEECNKYAPPGSRKWNEWRVMDLEGMRPGRPMAAIEWNELVTLCIVFDVLLWDLVLPQGGQDVSFSSTPKDADGWSEGRRYFLEAPVLGEILSGIPGEFLTNPQMMKKFQAMFNKHDLTVAQILDQQRDIQVRIGELVAMTHQIEGESTASDDSGEQGNGEHS